MTSTQKQARKATKGLTRCCYWDLRCGLIERSVVPFVACGQCGACTAVGK